jgi:hypothetical protein
MGVLTGSGYCPYCREDVMMACPAATDLFHLVLTLLSGGIWGIVWLYCRFLTHTCICCQCGRGLSRAHLKTSSPTIPDAAWPSEPRIRNPSDFNSILVARNLVYYMPTRAYYRRT